MIGRNDPCICGSGKKYKKCCALKRESSSEQLVDEELERLTLSYYENAIRSHADMAELERYEREWHRKLSRFMSPGEIETAVAEYFLFVIRRDLWNRYLLKTLNGSTRPATRAVLKTWQNPIVLFGKVTAIKEDYFLVDEVLGHETYYVGLEPGMKIEENLLVFGVVLPDRRRHANGTHLVGGLTFIHDQNGQFAQKIELMAEESGQASSYEFFKAHMVDIHKAIVEREINSVDDLVKRELTQVQQEVLAILVAELNDHGVPQQVLEVCQMITITYLLKEKPTFRKPEIIAAAVFKAVYDYEILGSYDYSQTEIAKMFGVSAGSMMKHVNQLYEIIEEIFMKIPDLAKSEN